LEHDRTVLIFVYDQIKAEFYHHVLHLCY